MRVYVETNFLLEVAYQQEQHGAAGGLLALADAGQISLGCPAFAVAEALGNLDRRTARRNDALRHVTAEARELSRSDPRRPLADRLRADVAELAGVSDDEADRLRAVVSRVARVAALLPFDADVDAAARRLVVASDLSDQDAIVLATVLADLAARPPAEPKLFVSRDAAAYTAAPVRAELRRFGCDFVSGFQAALSRVRAALNLP